LLDVRNLPPPLLPVGGALSVEEVDAAAALLGLRGADSAKLLLVTG
jgi:hypothetical protein